MHRDKGALQTAASGLININATIGGFWTCAHILPYMIKQGAGPEVEYIK